MTLADSLATWTDADLAMHALAKALGMVPENSNLGKSLRFYWAKDDITYKLFAILDQLAATGYLQKRNAPGLRRLAGFQFRVHPEF